MIEILGETNAAAADVEPDEAFAELFNGQFWALVRLSRLLGADDPEDVVQDAFLRLHRKRRMLREPGAAVPYLRAIVCNLSRSRLRHLRMARRRHAQLAVPEDTGSPEQQLTSQEDVRELLKAVAALPPRQREVLVLRYWLDLSERETSATLGIAVGTVKAHSARAIAALAKRLEETR